MSMIPTMATIFQPSINTPLQCDFAALPIERWNLFLHSSNLGWTYDLLRLTDCFGSKSVFALSYVIFCSLSWTPETALWRILSLFGGGQENTWRKTEASQPIASLFWETKLPGWPGANYRHMKEPRPDEACWAEQPVVSWARINGH